MHLHTKTYASISMEIVAQDWPAKKFQILKFLRALFPTCPLVPVFPRSLFKGYTNLTFTSKSYQLSSYQNPP